MNILELFKVNLRQKKVKIFYIQIIITIIIVIIIIIIILFK